MLRGYKTKEVKVKIMAAILRLADELDCSVLRIGDERRKEQLDINDPEQKRSFEHWEKLHCISRIYLSNDDNRVIILELNDSFINQYENKNQIFAKYLPEIVEKIQGELDSINTQVFSKKYCNDLVFKAEYVKIASSIYGDDINKSVEKDKIKDILFHKVTSKEKIDTMSKEDTIGSQVPNRKPADSTYVTMRNSVSDFLRVDSFSNRSLFWGRDGKPGMFYDYALDNRQTVKGRITLNHNQTDIKANKLDSWISENWLSCKQTFIHLLVGYAGCGKSTFVSHILNSQERGRYSTFWNFYNIQDYSDFSQDKSIELYLKDNLCYNIAKRLEKSQSKVALIKRFKDNLSFFRKLVPGVSCNVEQLISDLEIIINNECYNSLEIKDDIFTTNGSISKQVPYLALTYLWNASIQRAPSFTVLCVFDGLDIIDDPNITVRLIKDVFLLMKRYRKISNLPDVKLIITCRRFTLSLLETSSGDVSFGEVHSDYRDSISFLDISTLYQVSKVLKYKAKTICENPDLLKLKMYSKADRDKM